MRPIESSLWNEQLLIHPQESEKLEKMIKIVENLQMESCMFELSGMRVTVRFILEK